MKPYKLLLLSVIVCVAVFGCGSRKNLAETHILSGTVTLDGQPAASVFVSAALKMGKPIEVRTNEKGEYTIGVSTALNACIPGPAVISIKAFRQESNPNSQYLPAKYNTRAAQNPEMQVDVQSGNNTFDFALVSK